MSTPPMNEQSYLRFQFVLQVIDLGKECLELSKSLGISKHQMHMQFKPEDVNQFPRFFNLVTRSQAMLMEAKSLFATITEMDDYLTKEYGYALVARSNIGTVASYALQLEGDHHAEVSRYLKHWYQRPYCRTEATSLPFVRQMAELISRCFGSALDGHLPGLFKHKSNKFGDAYIQTKLFAQQADQQISEIVEQCRVSDDHAGFWIDKLKACERSYPEDFQLFKTLITTQLMKLDIPGLESLRTFILGAPVLQKDGEPCEGYS